MLNGTYPRFPVVKVLKCRCVHTGNLVVYRLLIYILIASNDSKSWNQLFKINNHLNNRPVYMKKYISLSFTLIQDISLLAVIYRSLTCNLTVGRKHCLLINIRCNRLTWMYDGTRSLNQIVSDWHHRQTINRIIHRPYITC